MKRILPIIFIIGLMFLLSTCNLVEGGESAEKKALALMINAVITGDDTVGAAAESELISLSQPGKYPSYQQLYTLSRFIASQTPVGRPSEGFLLCLGEVALNRLASPDYPDTLAQVCAQLGADTAALEQASPSRDCVDAALKLLGGQRMLSPEVVNFSGEKSGEVYATFYGRLRGYTYFTA